MMAGGWRVSARHRPGLGLGRTQQAIGDAQTNLPGATTPTSSCRRSEDMQANALAAQQSIASMQDATNRYGMNSQYQLGLGGLGLQDKSLDNNFYTTNRGLDLSQYSLGR